MSAQIDAQIDALERLAQDALAWQEQVSLTANRLHFTARRLIEAARQAAAKQELAGLRRYTEREAAGSLRVSHDTLRKLRRRVMRRDPKAWPCYTLEGVAGYFYTEAHLGQIASREYEKVKEEAGRNLRAVR
jgi:hypothetical protein